MKESNRTKASRVANACRDAYSANRYQSWEYVALRLLNMGLSEDEAEAVMRSKWTRWAADEHGADYGRVPAKALIDWMKNDPVECSSENIRGLVEGTY